MGEALRVYATPELIRDIEHTCRDLEGREEQSRAAIIDSQSIKTGPIRPWATPRRRDDNKRPTLGKISNQDSHAE